LRLHDADEVRLAPLHFDRERLGGVVFRRFER
jgi:hypothetical protein